MIAQTLIALGYVLVGGRTDIAERTLNPSRDADRGFQGGSLYCSCRSIAVGVVRHLPTGYRELYCGNDWHKDLTAFVNRAEAKAEWATKLRAQDDAYIAEHPEDTEYAAQCADMWAAHDVSRGTPQ